MDGRRLVAALLGTHQLSIRFGASAVVDQTLGFLVHRLPHGLLGRGCSLGKLGLKDARLARKAPAL
jgi:hypothetical protein